MSKSISEMRDEILRAFKDLPPYSRDELWRAGRRMMENEDASPEQKEMALLEALNKFTGGM